MALGEGAIEKFHIDKYSSIAIIIYICFQCIQSLKKIANSEIISDEKYKPASKTAMLTILCVIVPLTVFFGAAKFSAQDSRQEKTELISIQKNEKNKTKLIDKN